MADVQVIPTRITNVDDRFGNHYQIFQVNHTTGNSSEILVDQSAVGAAELNSDLMTSAGLVQEATESAGISMSDDDTTDGLKEVVIASGAASGTYNIVVRHIGSAAGLGS